MRDLLAQSTRGLSDLRQTLRGLGRRPLFALIATAILAIGIGVSTGVFSITHAVLLRPLPYVDPERLVDVRDVAPDGERPVSYPEYSDWRAGARNFADLAAYQPSSTALLADRSGALSAIGTVRASANLFALLGVRPELGRGFVDADELLSSERAMILSHALWASRFGSDAGVVGTTVLLDGVPRRVIGVLPASFRFYDGRADAWISLRMPAEFLERRNLYWLRVIGRLRPEATFEAAVAEMRATAARLEAAYPESNRAVKASVTTLRDRWTGDARPVLRALGFAVAGVFLIACVNVAGLFLVRGVSRRGDFALRIALGAGRLEALRQTFLEAATLALLAGAGGVGLAQLGVGVAVRSIPLALRSPYLTDSGLDLAAVGFALAAAVVAALLCGAALALTSVRLPVHDALRSGARGNIGGKGEGRLRRALVVLQLAVAVGVLSSAGLLVRSTVALLDTDAGFSRANVLVVPVALPPLRPSTPASLAAFERAVLDRVSALPGVASAATSNVVPLSGDARSAGFAVEGRAERPGEGDEAQVRTVSPSYFATLGLEIKAGRAFDGSERLGTPPTVIINASLAARLFPGESAVGKRLRFTSSPDEPTREIVGVVSDHRLRQLDQPDRATILSPSTQEPSDDLRLFVRAQRDPEALGAAVRATVLDLDREALVGEPVALRRVVEDSPSTVRRRLPATLLGSFAIVALLMAALGLYGLVAYAVTLRGREFGIRLALGAARRAVVGLVLREGAKPLALGLALGGALAVVAGRLLRGLLYEVRPYDAWTLVAVVAVIGSASLLACALPARRASRVDPARALREE